MEILRKLICLFDKEQRYQAVLLFGLILIAMTLETIGVGLIIPVLSIVSQPGAVQQSGLLGPFLKAFGNPNHVLTVACTMLVLVMFYSLKNSFLAYLAWRQPKFAFEVGTAVSQQLFEGYLHQPYVFHLQRNTAQLTNNVTHEVNLVVKYGLISAMNMTAEVLVLFAIVVLMFCIEPVGTLFLTIFLVLIILVYKYQMHAKISAWGETRQYYDGKRIQCVQQGLGGAKDARLLGREQDFFDAYRFNNVQFAQVARLQEMIDNMPRLWLEWFAVVAMAILVLIMLVQGRSPLSLVPVLGLFAAAAFRMMPSLSRILASTQCLSYALPVINSLHSEIKLLDNSLRAVTNRKELFFNQELEVKNLSYCYPGTTSLVLRDICLKIPKGASVGFVGSSGSGKSTLVDLILGLLTPTQGQVLLDGHNIQESLRGWQNLIGYVPQSIYLTDDTLRRNIAFGLRNDQIDEQAIERVLNSAQLKDFVSQLPLGLETLVGERGIRLSGGQRQRIGIARALYHDPEVFVLDEATSSLDIETEAGVMEAVQALHGKKTTVIVAHRLSTVAYCDFLYKIEHGCMIRT